MYSVVIPVYKNEGSLPEVLAAVAEISRQLDNRLEAVFVVDGSPDGSFELLRDRLPSQPFASRLLLLSRNFGSFAAVRAGLRDSTGPLFAVMAADLQEPPSLILEFFRQLAGGRYDIVVGSRTRRADPLLSRWPSRLFWWLYRSCVQAEVPPGGVDVFGCTREVRDQLLALEESNSTLVGLLFWVGYRRLAVAYARNIRTHGTSAWTLGRKVKYLLDSAFAFSDLPVRLLVAIGLGGMAVSGILSAVTVIGKLTRAISVPGYTATLLAVSFFGSLNCLALGIVGSYVWRTFENTKRRPMAIVQWRRAHDGQDGAHAG